MKYLVLKFNYKYLRGKLHCIGSDRSDQCKIPTLNCLMLLDMQLISIFCSCDPCKIPVLLQM